MLRGAGKAFYLVKSINVLVKSWLKNGPNSNCYLYSSVKFSNKNGRPCSFALKNLQIREPKHVSRLHMNDDKQARIIALIERVRHFQNLINDRQKERLTDKSKIVLENLLVVLNDMEKALRVLRQLF